MSSTSFAIIAENIVGYESVTIKPGRQVISARFDRVAYQGSLHLSDFLEGIREGDRISFGDFSAVACYTGTGLHWVSNGEVVDETPLPEDGVEIEYWRSVDETTALNFVGQVKQGIIERLDQPPPQPKPLVKAKESVEVIRPQRSLPDLMSYSTVQIESYWTNRTVATGTGFFYQLKLKKRENMVVPVIVSNRHVVKDSVRNMFWFTLAENGEPTSVSCAFLNDGRFGDWIFHPDPNVDLAVLPIKPFMTHIKAKFQKDVFYTPFDESFIPRQEEFSGIAQLDEVVMIGYPNGLRDEVNNQPIFRKGVLATNPNKNFKGERVFVVDMPVYGGSSGSPILLYSEFGYFDRLKRGRSFLPRVRLLGVNAATYQHTATGVLDVVVRQTAAVTNSVPRIRVPNHTGVIIHASRLLELEDYAIGLFEGK